MEAVPTPNRRLAPDDSDRLDELFALIRPHLAPDETVLWNAMAIPRHFTTQARTAFLAGTAVAIFMGFYGSQILDPSHVVQQGEIWAILIFSGIASGLLCAPLMENRRLSRTGYAVTNRRAFIVRLGCGDRGIEVYPKAEWGSFLVHKVSGGIGDIRFSWSMGMNHRKIGGKIATYGGREGEVSRHTEWLEGVREPERIVGLLRKLKDEES